MYIITADIGVTDRCYLFKLRRKHLTVSAPRSIEINDPRFVAGEHIVAELGRIQVDNTTGKKLKQPGAQGLGITEPVGVDTAPHKHVHIFTRTDREKL